MTSLGNEMKTIVEKYCPVVSRNVAVEFSGAHGGACCLHAEACRQQHGQCKNRFLTGDRHS